jgi:hypothetical protein
MSRFILKYRLYIIIASFAVGIAFCALIPFSETDPEIRNYVPEDMPSRVATDSIEDEFGVQDIVMVLFSDSIIVKADALEQIRKIDRGISRLPGISNRISPFTMRTIAGEDGMMVARKLISSMPGGKDEERALAANVLASRFARDIVISSDMTSAAITATINKSEPEPETIRKLDSLLLESTGPAEIEKGGLPYIRKYIIEDVRKDAVFLVPLALVIMLVILRLTLHEWKFVLLPFAVVMLSTGICMGLIPLFGWKLSIMTLLIPVILIAVANNYGIYIVARYQALSHFYHEDKASGNELIATILNSLYMPVLFSGLTTISGILGLLAHSIIPARQVGILCAIGVSIALIMSLMLIPAILSMQKRGRSFASVHPVKKDLLDKVSGMLGGLLIRHPGRILLVSSFIILFISVWSLKIRTETNQENFFPGRHPVKKASELINNKFGGSQTISVMISGEIRDPSVMNAIDRLSNRLENEPGIGGVFSISQVVHEMSKAIYNPGEDGYDMIPGSMEGISQMFELYNMSGDPGDFSQLVNPGYTRAHLLIRLSDPQISSIRRVRLLVDAYSDSFPAKLTVGGYALIMSDFAESVIRGQVSSLIFALSTVFILLSIIFRSLKGGMICSVPLAASIVFLFGLMGLSGIALDSATALLSSIMIGVGVDFTIQYVWSYKSFIARGLSYDDATVSAMNLMGRSIIINAAGVMAGFSVLMFSGFTSIRFFGYLVIISIGSCLAGALLIVPAILLKFKPSFVIEKRDKLNDSYHENELSNSYTGSSVGSSHVAGT